MKYPFLMVYLFFGLIGVIVLTVTLIGITAISLLGTEIVKIVKTLQTVKEREAFKDLVKREELAKRRNLEIVKNV